MSEASMANQMGVADHWVDLTIVRGSRDQGYHGLDRTLKRRVKRGDGVVINQAGSVTGVIDREEMRQQSVRQASQGTEFISIGKEDPGIKIIDATTRNRIAAKLAAGLNGDGQRARKLAFKRAEELMEGETIQAEIIRHSDSSRPSAYGVQTVQGDPNKRVKAYFSREGGDIVLRVICRVSEDERGRAALRLDGFTPPEIITRGAKRRG